MLCQWCGSGIIWEREGKSGGALRSRFSCCQLTITAGGMFLSPTVSNKPTILFPEQEMKTRVLRVLVFVSPVSPASIFCLGIHHCILPLIVSTINLIEVNGRLLDGVSNMCSVMRAAAPFTCSMCDMWPWLLAACPISAFLLTPGLSASLYSCSLLPSFSCSFSVHLV